MRQIATLLVNSNEHARRRAQIDGSRVEGVTAASNRNPNTVWRAEREGNPALAKSA